MDKSLMGEQESEIKILYLSKILELQDKQCKVLGPEAIHNFYGVDYYQVYSVINNKLKL